MTATIRKPRYQALADALRAEKELQHAYDAERTASFHLLRHIRHAKRLSAERRFQAAQARLNWDRLFSPGLADAARKAGL